MAHHVDSYIRLDFLEIVIVIQAASTFITRILDGCCLVRAKKIELCIRTLYY